LGLVYFVFLPAMVTTFFAAEAVSRFGPQRVMQRASDVVLLGLALGLVPSLAFVLASLALIGQARFSCKQRPQGL